MSGIASGFVSERLTEARVARGLSGADFANMVGVSAVSLSNYENAKQVPKTEIFDRIAEILAFPKSYFLRPVDHVDNKPIFWRSKMSAPAKLRGRAEVRLGWMKEVVDYLATYFDFPPLELFDSRQADISKLDDDFIAKLATELREYWSIRPGPMPNVLEKIENSGILVSRIHVHVDKLDAFSQWSDKFGLPFIVLSRDKASATRQRFDALHELFHILCHRNVEERHINHSATNKIIEQQANRFASHMLLPEKEFLDELYAPTLDSFLTLKERWGVSVGAMIVRCNDLDILDENSYRRMWINYNRRGWRTKEPLDNKIEKEEPLLIKKSFELLLSEGVQTPEEIKTALPFPITDLEEIADLDEGTLSIADNGRKAPTLKTINENVVVSLDSHRKH